MRRPQPQPPAAGAAIGAEQEATAGATGAAAEQDEQAGAAETGAEAKTGAAETAGAAETGTPEQPQPAAGAPNPPSMITPPGAGSVLIAGAPNDGPTAGALIAGALIAGAPMTDSPIEGPIGVAAPPQLLTKTGT